MNELRIERALRGGPPFATQYQAVSLPLDLKEGSRMPTTRRLVLVGLVALLAIAGALVAISGMFPNVPPLAGCPTARNEADAIDTFVEGIPAEVRAWRTDDSPSGSSRAVPGVIAVFAFDLPDAPLAVDSIDPATGARCRLVTFERGYQIADGANALVWSPGGDALAIGFDGQLLLWTPGGLRRIWTGDRFPRVTWAPDGSSIAVRNGFDGDDGTGSSTPGVRLLHADGRPDRVFVLDPEEPGTMELRWSPDGTRWVISTDTGIGVGSPSALRLVSMSDGAVTPLELGLAERTYRLVGWPDNEHFIVRASIYGQEPTQYLLVPVSNPGAFTTLAVSDRFAGSSAWLPVFSPDLTRIAIAHSDEAEVESELAVIDARTGQESTLARSPDEFRWAWSPDSRQIAYQTSEGIFTIDASGANRRLIASGSLVLLGDPWQAEASR